MLLRPSSYGIHRLASLVDHHIYRRHKAVSQCFLDVLDLLLQDRKLIRLHLVHGICHSFRDSPALSHAVIQGQDIVLQVSCLIVQKVDECHSLLVAKCLLDLDLFRCIHGLAKFAAQLVQDLRHGQKLVIGIQEVKPQLLASLGSTL